MLSFDLLSFQEVAASERLKRTVSTTASRHREYLGAYSGEELYHQQVSAMFTLAFFSSVKTPKTMDRYGLGSIGVITTEETSPTHFTLRTNTTVRRIF